MPKTVRTPSTLEDTLYAARMYPDRARLMLDYLAFRGTLFAHSSG